MTGSARASALALLLAVLIAACTSTGASDGSDPGLPPQPDASEPTATSATGGTLRIGSSSDPATLDPRFIVDDVGALIIDALFDPLVRVGADGQIEPAAAERWEIAAAGREFRFHLREATFHDGTPVTAEDFVRSFDRIADGTAEPESFLTYLLEAVEGADAAKARGAALSGVQAIDDRTLVIRLTLPDPGFLTTLTDPSLVPLPASADEDLAGFALQPVGNGPFAMAGPREPGDFIRLTRFAEHRAPPLLDEVVFSIYGGREGRERQFQDLLEGQLHVAELTPARRDEAIELVGASGDGYRGPGVIDGVTSTVYLYGFDTTVAPFDDVRVRRALSLSIDREALATEVMRGTRIAATSIVPPPLPGSRPGVCGDCRHDPEAAAALLAEVRADALEKQAGGPAEEEGAEPHGEDPTVADPTAGTEVEQEREDVPAQQDAAGAAADPPAQDEGQDPAQDEEQDPAQDEEQDPAQDEEQDEEQDPAQDPPPVLERITLTHTRGDTHTAIAERMAADIRSALGIEVDFQARDLQAFVASVRGGEVPLFRLGWQASVPDPGAYLRPLFHSSGVGADNYMRYVEPEVDALLDDARASASDSERIAFYRRAERRILRDMPVIPVLWYRHSVVVAEDVQGLVYSPLGRLNLDQISFDREAA